MGVKGKPKEGDAGFDRNEIIYFQYTLNKGYTNNSASWTLKLLWCIFLNNPVSRLCEAKAYSNNDSCKLPAEFKIRY